MNWVFLIGDIGFSLDNIKKIKHRGATWAYIAPEDENKFCVEFGSDHIFYIHDNSVIEQYEPGQLDDVPFKSMNFIMMIYNNYEKMSSVMMQEDFPHDIYIDNEHELIVPIKQFRAMGMPVCYPPYPPVPTSEEPEK